MVEPPTDLSLKRVRNPVVPERVLLSSLLVQPEYIHESPIFYLCECLTRGGVKADVPGKPFRISAIEEAIRLRLGG